MHMQRHLRTPPSSRRPNPSPAAATRDAPRGSRPRTSTQSPTRGRAAAPRNATIVLDADCCACGIGSGVVWCGVGQGSLRFGGVPSHESHPRGKRTHIKLTLQSELYRDIASFHDEFEGTRATLKGNTQHTGRMGCPAAHIMQRPTLNQR